MTSHGRRKNSACLFRIKENCPFRRLRRNKCSDSMNSIVLTGGQWETQTSVSNSDMNTSVRVETFSRPLQSVSHPHEEISAMDTDVASPTSIIRPSYIVSDTARPSHFNLINHQQRNMSSSNTSMDLDSGVDPETGERAQG